MVKKVLFVLIFINTNVWCLEEYISDFSGGLNTTVAAHKLPKNQSPFMRNVLGDEKPGSLVQIGGISQLGSTNTLSAGRGIFPYFLEDGTKKYVVTDSSVVLTTKDFQSYVAVSSGHTTTVLMNCRQIRNKMWCSNGADSVFTIDENDVKTTLDGTNGTPNVPKGKYLAFYQERGWAFNLSSDGSGLAFSRLTSTDGINIAPDDSRAWPSENQLNVGQGDGQIGTALYITNGQLFAGKENSIYTIYGTNETNYNDRRTLEGIGIASNDSVVNLDGNVYFLHDSGIYENGRRISDDIKSEINSIIKARSQVVQSVWDTESQFIKGDFSFGSTSTASGLLTVITGDRNIAATNPGNVTLNSGTTSYGYISPVFTSSVPYYYSGFLYFLEAGICKHDTNTPQVRFLIRNLNTGVIHAAVNENIGTICAGSPLSAIHNIYFSSQSPLFSGNEINSSSFSIKYELINNAAPNTEAIVNGGKGTYYLRSATTGQFVSEVSTIEVLTSWGNFDAESNANSGNINYFYRTSTSVVTITSQTWLSVNPGGIIDAPASRNYVQWASTISAVDSTNAPQIDKVTIEHVVGQGSPDRAIGIAWKNRYWLAVATEVGGAFSQIYIKAKNTSANKDALFPVDGINIRSLAKDGEEFLYAGSASTGIFYRLDNGTSYDGLPIVAEYQTPDLVLGDYFRDKKIHKYLIDVEKESGANLKIGTSIEGGAFSEISSSIDGTGRKLLVIEGVTNYAKYLRLRLKNDELDKTLILNNVGIVYDIIDKLK